MPPVNQASWYSRPVQSSPLEIGLALWLLWLIKCGRNNILGLKSPGTKKVWKLLLLDLGEAGHIIKSWPLWNHHDDRKPRLATWSGHMERGWWCLVSPAWCARHVSKEGILDGPASRCHMEQRGPFLPSPAQIAELWVIIVVLSHWIFR